MTSTPLVPAGEQFTSKKPSKRKKAGRICSLEGCDTVLSVYNTDDRCSIHVNENKPVRVRGRKIY